MEILFDKKNKIMGGRTTKYLLEKVCYLSPNDARTLVLAAKCWSHCHYAL
jgi:hypothetical protein